MRLRIMSSITAACLVLPAHVPSAQAQDWTLRATTGPRPRQQHAMAYDSARGVVVLFGGWNGFTFGDTWEWDGAVWTARTRRGPSPRVMPSMAYDSARGVTVLFGGISLGGPPPAGTTLHNDTWEWDGVNWTEVQVVGPSARCCTPMVYDSVRGVMVLFGGSVAPCSSPSACAMSDETWEFDGSAWVQANVPGPSARWDSVMAFDEARGVSVLFGGSTTGTFSCPCLDETWTWDGSSWQRHGVSGPSPRKSTAAVFDAARQSVVLFGGFTGGGTILADTWMWDGSAWTEANVSGPSPRELHAMAYDSRRGATVLFGGSLPGISGETWEFSCYADCDVSSGIGVLDIFDFLCFQNSFVSGEPYACDCDPDPACNIFDFLCFQTAFVNGCP